MEAYVLAVYYNYFLIMFDAKLFECFSSYLNQLPPFALTMMDAQPLLSKICVCRTKDLTSDAGSCTFEDATIGSIVKIYRVGRSFFRCMATYLLVKSKKSKRTDCEISELEREEREANLLRAEVVKLLERESDFLSRN